MGDVATWVAAAAAVLSLALAVWGNYSKAAAAKVAKVERAVEQKAESATVTLLAAKVDLVEDRIIRIETDLKHLPDNKTANELKDGLADLRAQVGVLSERIKPIAAISDRVQQALLERVTG